MNVEWFNYADTIYYWFSYQISCSFIGQWHITCFPINNFEIFFVDNINQTIDTDKELSNNWCLLSPISRFISMGPRWLTGRASDSGARGPGLKPHDRRIVSLSKTLKGSERTGKYPGSGGSVPK